MPERTRAELGAVAAFFREAISRMPIDPCAKRRRDGWRKEPNLKVRPAELRKYKRRDEVVTASASLAGSLPILSTLILDPARPGDPPGRYDVSRTKFVFFRAAEAALRTVPGTLVHKPVHADIHHHSQGQKGEEN